jgi:hypothetical protein
MKRMILAGLAAATMSVVVSGTGCQQTGVGDPCTPEAEYSTTFTGFDFKEVSTESADYQCFSRLCLVNHFQGLVSCPYGQDATGNGAVKANPGPAFGQAGSTATAPKGCQTPYIQAIVDGETSPNSGTFIDPNKKATVSPQCLDRRADSAVYCSCRCANLDGKTDDGAVYCTCPSGFTCSQLYTSIGQVGNQGLTGAYCIKSGTEYDMNNVCMGVCTVSAGGQGNCQSAQGANGM